MTNISTRFQIQQRNPVSDKALASPLPEPMQNNFDRARALLAEEFMGVTTDGRVVPGLYQLRKTGLSTDPIKYSQHVSGIVEYGAEGCCVL